MAALRVQRIYLQPPTDDVMRGLYIPLEHVHI